MQHALEVATRYLKSVSIPLRLLVLCGCAGVAAMWTAGAEAQSGAGAPCSWGSDQICEETRSCAVWDYVHLNSNDDPFWKSFSVRYCTRYRYQYKFVSDLFPTPVRKGGKGNPGPGSPPL